MRIMIKGGVWKNTEVGIENTSPAQQPSLCMHP